MGTEAFWIPAAIAAASAGAQYANQSAATSRQNNAEVTALGQQQQLRQQANDQTKNLTQQINTDSPNQIANQEQTQFVNTLRQNEAGTMAPNGTSSAPNTNFGQPVSALGATAGASNAYKKGSAAAQQEVQQYGNTNASEMSAVDAAVRQRQNEGLSMQSLGANLNLLQGQSQLTNFVDQLRAQAAGQQNPWVSMFSKVGGTAANSMANNGWFSGTPAADAQTINQYPAMSPGYFAPPAASGIPSYNNNPAFNQGP